MADNIKVLSATDPEAVPVRTKQVGGTQTQIVQSDIGGENAEVLVVAGRQAAATSVPAVLSTEDAATLATIVTNTGHIPAPGQALAADSMPVVLPADQLSALTPPAAITGFATAANQSTELAALAQLENNTTGLATAANQTTQETTLSTIATNTTGLATATAQTTSNTSLAAIATSTAAAATAVGQTTELASLATIATNTGHIPAPGQALSGASTPVVLPAAQITALTPLASVGVTNFPALQPISATALPLPSGAASAANQSTEIAALATIASNTNGVATATAQTTGNTSLATIATNTGKIPSPGAAAMAGSTPVTMATDQPAIPVSGPAVVICPVTLTRPANTTAYSAGQIINHVTSGDSPLAFTGATRVSGGNGMILSAKIVDNVHASTPGVFELYLFKSAPANNANSITGPNDAQPLSLTAADGAALVPNGVIPFYSSYLTNAAASPAGQLTYSAGPLQIGFALASGTTLYGLLVNRTTSYTPISAEVFQIDLTIAWS